MTHRQTLPGTLSQCVKSSLLWQQTVDGRWNEAVQRPHKVGSNTPVVLRKRWSVINVCYVICSIIQVTVASSLQDVVTCCTGWMYFSIQACQSDMLQVN